MKGLALLVWCALMALTLPSLAAPPTPRADGPAQALGASHAGVAIELDPAVERPVLADLPGQELADQIVDLVSRHLPAAHPSAPDAARRVVVTIGRPDARLKLAPCARATVHLPAGTRPWGRIRVGVRCQQGAVRWTAFLPVEVRIWGQGLVSTAALSSGTTLEPMHLRPALVEWTEEASPAVRHAEEAWGREISRALPVGATLREAALRVRRYFEAGDPVRLIVRGPGFAVSAEGQALNPGEQGRCARIRTEGGRVVCAQPIAERTVELKL